MGLSTCCFCICCQAPLAACNLPQLASSLPTGLASERPVRLAQLLFWIVQSGFLMGHDL